VGAAVEARFGGGADYYGGVVVRAHGDGSVDLQYDDGDHEDHVAPQLVRRLDEDQSSDESVSSDDAAEESDSAGDDGNVVRTSLAT